MLLQNNFIYVQILHFLHRILARACGVPVFGRSTAGNDVVATYNHQFFFPFFPLSRPFLSSHIFRHAINMFVNMV